MPFKYSNIQKCEEEKNAYITKQSAPQTEISYICQHFGWRSSFKDKYLNNGNF